MQMKTSNAISNICGCSISKIILISTAIIALSSSTIAQPVWQNGTPTVTPRALLLELTFRLDRPSYIYYNITRAHYPTVPLPAPNNVKNWSSQPVPFGAIDHNGSVTYNAGDVGTDVTIQIEGEAVPIEINHDYGILVTAEDQATGTLSQSFVINVTTPPCPDFWLDINHNSIGECISAGAGVRGYYEASHGNEIVEEESGVFTGTTWHVEWGDGQTYDYISMSYDDFPPIQLHT